MSRKYFGTDGVRGEVGQLPITPDFVMRLGYAAGTTLVAREHLPVGEHPAVLIGKDTRISGYMLEAALEAGFAAAGVDVCLVGPMPTPAVAYLTRALRLQAGVVISASHNAYQDNGIKFFSAQGAKLPDAVETEIEARLEQPIVCKESAQLGKARRIDDAAGRYIEFCKSTFPAELDLRGLRPWRRLPHCPQGFSRTRCGNRIGRRVAQWPQHQRWGRRDIAGFPAPRRGGLRGRHRHCPRR
jgi:phosphoglucosamine mutase